MLNYINSIIDFSHRLLKYSFSFPFINFKFIHKILFKIQSILLEKSAVNFANTWLTWKVSHEWDELEGEEQTECLHSSVGY